MQSCQAGVVKICDVVIWGIGDVGAPCNLSRIPKTRNCRLGNTIALAVISTGFQGYEYMEAFEPVELFIEALQEAPLTQSTSSNVR